jgi:hypothetical protein
MLIAFYILQWETVYPSPSSHVDHGKDFELVRLRLIWWDAFYVGPDVRLETDRQIKPTTQSRKHIENMLAMTALDDLVGENFDWRSIPVKQVRSHILSRLQEKHGIEGGDTSLAAA